MKDNQVAAARTFVLHIFPLQTLSFAFSKKIHSSKKLYIHKKNSYNLNINISKSIKIPHKLFTLLEDPCNTTPELLQFDKVENVCKPAGCELDSQTVFSLKVQDGEKVDVHEAPTTTEKRYGRSFS